MHTTDLPAEDLPKAEALPKEVQGAIEHDARIFLYTDHASWPLWTVVFISRRPKGFCEVFPSERRRAVRRNSLFLLTAIRVFRANMAKTLTVSPTERRSG